MRYYLAIDIGASSGRHILGWLDGDTLRIKEVYRFPNSMVKRDGSLCWDVDALLAEVTTGIRLCSERSIDLVSVGIDTWGVDFVLLDKNGNSLGSAVAYRDSRTEGMDAEVERLIPYAEHYARTGIQKQPFNTVYQLMALKLKNPRLLEQADCMLLMPDYLNYRLTGEKPAEYTIASTTGLLNAETRDWDWSIIDTLGFPRRIFLPIVHDTIPSHDTASAFLAVPSEDDSSIFISSGTWSLLGILSDSPILTDTAREAGFTNEGGYSGKIRFLKNIMGLWMIQSVRREIGNVDFPELSDMAKTSDYNGLVDVNNECFFAPESMIETVRRECVSNGYPVPKSTGDILKCIYHSLARSYAQSVKGLERITGKMFTHINIIGGGSQDQYLNKLTAQATRLPICAGLVEATALGNLISQMITAGELSDIRAARAIVRECFEIKEILS